ncbi:hypothetical protein EYF80_023666 [Liparis tanakae]|uniref:Uncharacterized protein n=1 Tax=Liparis tanakae TaxID=230148 RepID=A0A4Z2HK40_9TELE|nr:hypothetical protein EYF80_023666 [Liparis tanakae]
MDMASSVSASLDTSLSLVLLTGAKEPTWPGLSASPLLYDLRRERQQEFRPIRTQRGETASDSPGNPGERQQQQQKKKKKKRTAAAGDGDGERGQRARERKTDRVFSKL